MAVVDEGQQTRSSMTVAYLRALGIPLINVLHWLSLFR